MLVIANTKKRLLICFFLFCNLNKFIVELKIHANNLIILIVVATNTTLKNLYKMFFFS